MHFFGQKTVVHQTLTRAVLCFNTTLPPMSVPSLPLAFLTLLRVLSIVHLLERQSEELEQSLIEKSVTFDPNPNKLFSSRPFLKDPLPVI